MVYILSILWVATICVIAEAQFHPIEAQDLKNIVDSVKKDVDRHLKKASVDSRIEPSQPNPPEHYKYAVVEDVDKFMKMIQDSMHHHLVRNLGKPIDAKKDGSPVTENSLNEDPDYLQKKPLKSKEGSSDFSSQVHEIRVGSTKGMPGVHFPDYTDIPRTSFMCSDKAHLPGFYADLETGCQVFHVCWPDRRESFLCPMGTIFNQALKVCDYWYNSNCSLAPYYYTVNADVEPGTSKVENASSMINILLEKADSAPKHDSLTKGHPAASSVSSFVAQFMPIKAKIVVYPETANKRSKIVTSASIGGNKAGFKSRSPQKKRSSSKNSRTRRSVEDDERILEYVRDVVNGFQGKNDSFLQVLHFRFAESLDEAVEDIKSNTTLSELSEHVEKLVNFIKRWFLMPDLPESLDLEPGSELYEYDIGLQEKFSNDTVRVARNAWLLPMAGLWYYWDLPPYPLEKEVAANFEETDAPLTRLNPRFIVEPATESSRLQKDEAWRNLKMRVKRAATISHPMKHEGPLSIYPVTKKALLKNYMKLFKTKRA